MKRDVAQSTRTNIPESSTVSIEGRWCKALISDEDLKACRATLRRLESLQKVSKTLGEPDPVLLPLPKDWSRRMLWLEGESGPRILIETGEEYDFRTAYKVARRELDPLLSPHGFFMAMKYADHGHAVEFLKEFGPLQWTGRLDYAQGKWISLADFWAKHARFFGIVKLWEALNKRERDLVEAWEWIRGHLEEIKLAGPAPLGCDPQLLTLEDGRTQYSKRVWLPWQLSTGTAPAETNAANFLNASDQLRLMELVSSMRTDGDLLHVVTPGHTSSQYRIHRGLAVALIQHELGLQTKDSEIGWALQEEKKSVSFKPVRLVKSLWAAMWELFALDTGGSSAWRHCVLCGRLFYPRRSNSVCCKPEEQARWSKREWARRARLRERSQRKINLKKRKRGGQ